MISLRVRAALLGALLLLAVPAAAQEADSAGEGEGRPVVSVTMAASPRALYVAALDALERHGYQLRVRLLDEVLVTFRRREFVFKDGYHPQVAVELKADGDSTRMVVSGVALNPSGEEIAASDEQGLAAILMAEVSVTAAVDSALDRAGGQPRTIDARELGAEFGYGRQNPVRVGGGYESGAANQRAYLGRLRGPGGETVRFRRLGSCCNFQTEHSPDGTGALDAYEVAYDGEDAPRIIYIDLYTPPPAVQRAPAGFTLQPDANGPRSG